jgi:uncharacterized membrane protein YqgA involved in biofilm formation
MINLLPVITVLGAAVGFLLGERLCHRVHGDLKRAYRLMTLVICLFLNSYY